MDGDGDGDETKKPKYVISEKCIINFNEFINNYCLDKDLKNEYYLNNNNIFKREQLKKCVTRENINVYLLDILLLLLLIFKTQTTKFAFEAASICKILIQLPIFFIEQFNNVFLSGSSFIKNQNNQTYLYKFNLLNILYEKIEFKSIQFLWELIVFIFVSIVFIL